MVQPAPAVPRIALQPSTAASVPAIASAITDAGAQLSEPAEADALVWVDPYDPGGLAQVLIDAPGVRWVQLPFAGIENFVDVLDPNRFWTCGKGVYADPVAELALGLGVAGLRGIGHYARQDRWSDQRGVNLIGGRITIVGGGGITESFLRLIRGWDCRVTVVRRQSAAMEGVDRVLGPEQLHESLDGADLVVLALALTPETDGLIGTEELEIMHRDAWLVNVARGRHIVTDDLVAALESGSIGGAGLDVTEPEPLPSDHALWRLPNCIITPHVGNTREMAVPLLARRVGENVRRFIAGEELIGPIDLEAGY
jgi:phosphoglycerate dehydrogenase-like enzyme